MSYYDGFFVSPTQVLAKATTSGGKGVAIEFKHGQKLDAYTVFEDISQVTPDVTRELLISGGFLNNLANTNDPKSFEYVFEGIGFPNAPLLQPRLGSIEEWKFLNDNNDEHPIHIHVNDFQVTYYLDPYRGIETGPEMWAVDNANVPAPVFGPEESVIQKGALNLRMKFDDFIGLFVMHCHRLNHEDNGLMMVVNVIPAASTYAVAVPGSPGQAAQVKVYDANGDRLVATVTPFAGFGARRASRWATSTTTASTISWSAPARAMRRRSSPIRARRRTARGRSRPSLPVSRHSIPRRKAASAWPPRRSTARPPTTSSSALAPACRAKSECSAAKLFVAAGQGALAVLVLQPLSRRSERGQRRLGLRRFLTGRYSIVTAPGAGSMAQVKVFDFPLMPPIGQNEEKTGPGADQCEPGDNKPAVTNAFMPFGMDYRGGLSLATGWLTGPLGGAETIVVGQLDRPRRGQGLFERLAAGGGAAKSIWRAADQTPIATFSRDRELQAVRRRRRA